MSFIRPLPQPSGRVRCRPLGSSLQPVTVDSTERQWRWKRGEPFVPAGPLGLALGVEAAARRPGAVGGGVAGLRVETGGEGERVGEATALDLHVSGPYAPLVPPEAQALVANALGDADGLSNRRALGRGRLPFVLKDEHLSCRLCCPCRLRRTGTPS